MIGHSLEDLDALRRELGQEPVSGSFRKAGDLMVDLGGAAIDILNPVGSAAQSRMTAVENVMKPAMAARGVSGGAAKGLLGLGRMGARLAPGLAGLGVVGAAADTLLDDTNFSNKAQDALGMGVGAVLGSPLGPLGTMFGAQFGKYATDGLQSLFGGGEPESNLMVTNYRPDRGGLY